MLNESIKNLWFFIYFFSHNWQNDTRTTFFLIAYWEFDNSICLKDCLRFLWEGRMELGEGFLENLLGRCFMLEFWWLRFDGKNKPQSSTLGALIFHTHHQFVKVRSSLRFKYPKLTINFQNRPPFIPENQRLKSSLCYTSYNWISLTFSQTIINFSASDPTKK